MTPDAVKDDRVFEISYLGVALEKTTDSEEEIGR